MTGLNVGLGLSTLLSTMVGCLILMMFGGPGIPAADGNKIGTVDGCWPQTDEVTESITREEQTKRDI